MQAFRSEADAPDRTSILSAVVGEWLEARRCICDPESVSCRDPSQCSSLESLGP